MATPARKPPRDLDAEPVAGEVLDDGAIAGTGPHPDDPDPARDEPIDDALVDELAETVDVRDLPPKVLDAQLAASASKPPTTGIGSRKSHAERREERRAERAEAKAATDPVLSPLAKREDQTLREYLEELTKGEPEVKISLKRERPEQHQGVKCNGLLESYTRLIDENEIKETHGGGKFQLQIYRKGVRGDWRYLKHVTLEIAGDPKVDSLRIRDGAPADGASAKTEATVVGRVLDMFEKRGAERNSGPDMALVNAMLAPMQAQMNQLQRALERKDAELSAIRDKPTDPYKDRFVEKLIDQDSARIAAIKTQHDAELGAVKAGAVEDLKRERDRADRELARVTAQYERELATLKEATAREIQFIKDTHARELAALRQGYESQISQGNTLGTVNQRITDAEIKRLERDNDQLRKENLELRAKKEQSLSEKVKEIQSVKDLISDDDDDEDKGVIAKLLESPLAAKAVEKFGGMFGGATPEQQMLPQNIPPGVPFTLPDGRVAMRDQQGNLRVKRTVTPPAQAGGTPPVEGAAAGVPGVDPQQVKDAIQFMEGAFRSNTDPKAFAASVRNMVPPAVTSLLSAHGVDDFFDKVAGLEATSPLAQQAGRLWARKVAKALVGADE